MEREIFIVRDGAVVWRGVIKPAIKGGASAATREYFEEAWRQALVAGAVAAADAGNVQFRISAS